MAPKANLKDQSKASTWPASPRASPQTVASPRQQAAMAQEKDRGMHAGTFRPPGAPVVSPNERVTVSEKERLYLNGETKACMEHARMLKTKIQDSSVDQPWDIVEKPWTDFYAKLVTILVQPLKALVAYPLLLLFQLPFLIALRLYVCTLPTPCDMPNRTGCGYRIFVVIILILGSPVVPIVLLCYLWDLAAYYFFGLLYMFATCGCCRYCKSSRAINPWRNGPCVWWHLNDLVTALLGQVCRQGILHSDLQLAGTWVLIPWVKYWLNVNPFLFDLSDRYVQQISTSWQDMSLDDIMIAAFRSIGRTKPKMTVRSVAAKWPFAPHYPFPPPWKRWSLGIQATDFAWLIVHTTPNASVNGGSTEQFVVSNSYLLPGARIMLWYNNPYHFLVGWVEASITCGHPQQTDKDRGGEHPMWLCAGKSRLSAARTAKEGSWTGAARVDAFFDYWLPMFTHEMRRQNKGVEEANKLREGVISKEGISRPSRSLDVPRVDPGNGWGFPAPVPNGAFKGETDPDMYLMRMGQKPFNKKPAKIGKSLLDKE